MSSGGNDEIVAPGASWIRLFFRAALVAADFWVLSSSPAVFGRFATTANGRFLPGTALLVLINVLFVATWMPRRGAGIASPAVQRALAERWVAGLSGTAMVVVAAGLLFTTARLWMGSVLTSPLDPRHGDMLPAVAAALANLVRGHDPYNIYYVPWAVPLPYGPLLWLPYLLPFLLRLDLRVVSVVGELFIPAACFAGAIVLAFRASWPRAVVLATLGWVVLSNPDLRGFTDVAHTPSYWPLLLVFSILVASRRWVAASAALGLLIAARTTMVSIVPVWLIAAWHQDRRAMPKMVGSLLACAALPFVPFAIWDFDKLRYGMFGSYIAVMKDVVWTSSDGGALKTFGLTGFLLSHGWKDWVEVSQFLVLALVYIAAWRPLKRGVSPLPWAGLALLCFSMTTLWPVYYVYFDVFLLLVCAVLAEEHVPDLLASRHGVRRFVAVVSFTVVAVVGSATLAAHPDYYTIDASNERSRWRLSGFGHASVEGDRHFAWVTGPKATILLGRTTRRAAALRIDCRPFLPSDLSQQTLQLVVNGFRLQRVVLPSGWSSISMPVPASAWVVGVNRVDLYFGYAASPGNAAGTSPPSPPTMAAAVERVGIEPPKR